MENCDNETFQGASAFGGSTQTSKHNLNPNLEKLRGEALQEVCYTDDEQTTRLIERARRIHASCLFDPPGMLTLQTFCRCLSATRSSPLYSGWREIGFELNIDQLVLQCIENCILNGQDPTYNLLSAFMQKEDATLDKLVVALQNNKRLDVVAQIQDVMFQMVDKLDKIYENSTDEILTSQRISRVPFIFANLEKPSDTITTQQAQNIPKLIQPKQSKYNKIVMLTYTGDGMESANVVAKTLRTEGQNSRIGVIVLQEHIEKVNENPELFICSCFQQADYVMPILTLEYLNRISSAHRVIPNALENMDVAYASYVHTLMVNDYFRRGCKNTKIRAVIPDELVTDVHKHPFMNVPQLRVWIQLSDVQNFAQQILRKSKH